MRLHRLRVRPQLAEWELEDRLSAARAALASGLYLAISCGLDSPDTPEENASLMEWILLELEDLGQVFRGPLVVCDFAQYAFLWPREGPGSPVRV